MSSTSKKSRATEAEDTHAAGHSRPRARRFLVDLDLTPRVIHQWQHAGDRDARDAGFGLESSLELLVAAVNLPVNVEPAAPGTLSRSIAIVAARYCSGTSPAFAARARWPRLDKSRSREWGRSP